MPTYEVAFSLNKNITVTCDSIEDIETQVQAKLREEGIDIENTYGYDQFEADEMKEGSGVYDVDYGLNRTLTVDAQNENHAENLAKEQLEREGFPLSEYQFDAYQFDITA